MQERAGALHAEEMGKLVEVAAKTPCVIELGNQAAVSDGWAVPSQIARWTPSDHLLQCCEPILDELTSPLGAGLACDLAHTTECGEVLERLNPGVDGLRQLPCPGFFPGIARNQAGSFYGAVDPAQDSETLA